jgi:hypothetical protein
MLERWQVYIQIGLGQLKRDYVRSLGLNGEGNIKMDPQELSGGRFSTGLIWHKIGTASGLLLKRY